MKGMLQSVSTLWTTVGLPWKPRSAGNGGRAETVPRNPWRDASSAVSSPTTYDPAPSTILDLEVPPARRAALDGRAQDPGVERGYSERTSTQPCAAPTA